MADVKLRHPELPDQPITVNEAAVWHYERSGWAVAEDQPVAEEDKQAPAAESSTVGEQGPEWREYPDGVQVISHDQITTE